MIKTKLKLKAFHHIIIYSYRNYLQKVAKKWSFSLFFSMLPKQVNKINFLKSPMAHKKAREHFVINMYTAVIYIYSNRAFPLFLLKNKPTSLNITISRIQKEANNF